MDGTGCLFEAFLHCLPAGMQTKIITYPTHIHLSYEQLEELVASQLPATGDYTIIAESFSGPIALRLAGRAPTNLQAIVLVASFAYRPLAWKGSILARLPWSIIFRLPPPNFILRTFLLGTSPSADEVTRVRSALRKVRAQVLAARLQELLTSEYGNRQLPPNVRTVAIFAEDDRLLGRRARQSIAEVCPHAEIQFVSAPHLALQAAPAAIWSALQKLLVLT